jgi:hypothetical protein
MTQLKSCINNITIIWALKKNNVHEILVDLVEGGGGSGQKWTRKLGFYSFLPSSP